MQRDRRWYVHLKPLEDNKYHLWKRVFDIIASFILLVFCIPLFLTLSLSIAISSGFPIIFMQTRTGLNNQPFTIFKFRTMVCDKRKGNGNSYTWREGVPDNFTFKNAFDANVTTIGKYLRKYSLDELPQLFNVFIGNMSIVGPRPEIPEITIHYNHHQRKRLMAKPGITGYAQVNGRSEINHGQKIEYDLLYIKKQSFLLDLKIILSTVSLAMKGKGAF